MTAMQSGAGETSWTVGAALSTASAILFSHFAAFAGTALAASLPSLAFDYFMPESYSIRSSIWLSARSSAPRWSTDRYKSCEGARSRSASASRKA